MFSRFATVVLVMVAFWGAFAHASGASGHSGTYVVKAGDTLWLISQNYYSGDTRRGVWDLEQRNDIGQDAVLVSGQRIVLPW